MDRVGAVEATHGNTGFCMRVAADLPPFVIRIQIWKSLYKMPVRTPTAISWELVLVRPRPFGKSFVPFIHVWFFEGSDGQYHQIEKS
jgi:hypothetical protein